MQVFPKLPRDVRELRFLLKFEMLDNFVKLSSDLAIWTVLNRDNWITFHAKQFGFDYPSRYSGRSGKKEHFDSMWMNLLSKKGVKNQLQPGDQ